VTKLHDAIMTQSLVADVPLTFITSPSWRRVARL